MSGDGFIDRLLCTGRIGARPLLPLTIIFILTACTDAGGETSGFALRDSAGVWIAENTAPAWADAPEWSIAPEPSMRIGMLEGPEEYQLTRVSSAVRLRDGGVALANGQTEIRVYAPDGSFVRRIGREGSGPGEFRNLGALFLKGDTLVASDFGLRRISTFDAQGEFVASQQLEPWEGMSGSVRGITADGDLILGYTPFYRTGEVEAGVSRNQMWVLRQQLGATVIDTITDTPGTESFVRLTEGGFSVSPLLLGRNAVFAVRDSIIAIGDNNSYEIRLFGKSGELRRLIRRDVPVRQVTEAMWRLAIDEQLQRVEEMEPEWIAMMRPLYAEMPRPATLPFYQTGLIDSENHLWIRNVAVPGEDRSAWSIFDPDGRWLGDVHTPEGLNVREIGDDYLLGIWQDDMEVEYVHIHELRRGER